MTQSNPSVVQQKAGRISAESGQVVMDGPDGVAVTMSPDAADETGRRLIDAAQEARRQDEGPAPDA